MLNTLIDQRYRLLADIGKGGEAHVFRARDEGTGGEVAIRLALHEGRQNAETAPDFSHENWVQLLGTGTDPERGPYRVFELLEGQTLGKLVESAPLSPEDWGNFVDQSLAAVEAVHSVNAVHGDINADNFFLTASGWKMLELPFHRFTVPEGRSNIFGSIYTLAPEQIDGKPPGVASDIYSLACLYYYAASGTWPHPGHNEQEVAISCLLYPPTSLREAAPTLPRACSDWVMKLLAPKPADRPSSIAAARQLLADAVA